MIRTLQGDCRDVLPTLDAGSVQCVVTSPPYFGLRAYLPDGHPDKHREIGQEPTPDAFVAALVAVFRGVRRVLRDDGTVWLNLGDSYAAGGNGPGSGKQLTNAGAALPPKIAPPGCKPKDLLMIPAQVALALRADGWFLRSDIIWSKPNPMPESVTDRPTSAHEHVFLLTKSARYFYDAEAIAEGRTEDAMEHTRRYADSSRTTLKTNSDRNDAGLSQGTAGFVTGATRNARNVWTIATQPFSGAHFATMPPDLAERCVKAGSKPGDMILDPFGGAGTTGLVADRLGRNATLIELNPEYRSLAAARIADDAGLFAQVAAE